MIAFILNLIIVFLEFIVFIGLKRKNDVFKYYTYFQNYIALITSLLFCVFFFTFKECLCLLKGVRYVVTCSLILASFVYIVILSKNNKFTKDDFNIINPNLANIILHYICPILSLISLVYFETNICIIGNVWTMIACVPSILYLVIYIILTTIFKEEPYKVSKNNNLFNIISLIFIPFIFILISYVLWNII